MNNIKLHVIVLTGEFNFDDGRSAVDRATKFSYYCFQYIVKNFHILLLTIQTICFLASFVGQRLFVESKY